MISASLLPLMASFRSRRSRFPRCSNRIQLVFGIEKLSGKIEKFFELSFNDFLKEVYKKSKTRLSLKDQDEWNEYFNGKKSNILQLESEMEQCENHVDEIVFKMYELTSSEIQFIEKTLSKSNSS